MIKLANGATVLRAMLVRSAPGSVTGNAVRVLERVEGVVLALSASDYVVWTVGQSAYDASVYDAYNGDYFHRGGSLGSDHDAYVHALLRFRERAV